GTGAPRPSTTGDELAEADGNRTRLTEMLGHNGFEDRARHQTRYASGTTLGMPFPDGGRGLLSARGPAESSVPGLAAAEPGDRPRQARPGRRRAVPAQQGPRAAHRHR